jgi:hypothetical protein
MLGATILAVNGCFKKYWNHLFLVCKYAAGAAPEFA